MRAFIRRFALHGQYRSLCGSLVLGLWSLAVNRVPAEPAISSPPPVAYEGPEVLTGSIYREDSHPEELLYRFKRVATRSGSTLKVLREYTYPNGTVAARERVLYQGKALRLYELEELQTGSAGKAVIESDPRNPGNGTIVFQYSRKVSSPTSTSIRHEPLVPGILVNDMVGPFLSSNFERLQQGETIPCRFVAIPHRETVGFGFKKESDATWRGKDVMMVKLKPTSPFIAALVDPLLLTVEKAPPHRVLQYVGMTTPKILEGNHWKDLGAITVFDWEDTGLNQ